MKIYSSAGERLKFVRCYLFVVIVFVLQLLRKRHFNFACYYLQKNHETFDLEFKVVHKFHQYNLKNEYGSMYEKVYQMKRS